MTEVERGPWFPGMPPALSGETSSRYTDRLTGADGTGRRPYDHHRRRQCSLGYHDTCSDPAGEDCECPCHRLGVPVRVFRLVRDVDETGVSGTGLVAEGVEFSDGVVALRWLAPRSSRGQGTRTSVVFHDHGLDSVARIHGHGGKTRIVWDGDPLHPGEEPPT